MKGYKKIIVYLLPLISFAIIYILKEIYFRYIASLNIPCFFHLFTGYWCPGCGGTRSVSALFKGDIPGSLRYNLFPVLMIILGFMGYVQLILKINGSKKRILPENDAYIVVIVLIMVAYYIIRNFVPFLMPHANQFLK